MSMQLALYRPHRWQDIGGYVIAWWTQGPYSHCELVIDGACYSSSIRDDGVRSKEIDIDKPHWTVIDIDGDEAHALRAFAQHEGEPYGWADLVSQQIVRLPVRDTHGEFCSALVARMLGLPEPRMWSPNGLARKYGVIA